MAYQVGRTVAATASANRQWAIVVEETEGGPSRTAQSPHRATSQRRHRSKWSPHSRTAIPAASDGVPAKNATDSQRHRQTMAQIQMMKRVTATQALQERPRSGWNRGRMRPSYLQAIGSRPIPRTASQIAIGLSIGIISAAGLGSVASGRASKAGNRHELWRLAWQCVPREPTPATGPTAPLDPHHPLRYSEQNHKRLRRQGMRLE